MLRHITCNVKYVKVSKSASWRVLVLVCDKCSRHKIYRVASLATNEMGAVKCFSALEMLNISLTKTISITECNTIQQNLIKISIYLSMLQAAYVL